MGNYSLFLSHSSLDKSFVRRLARDLSSHNIRVWVDEAEMLVGDSLIEKIETGITKMDYVGAVISRNSVASEWVRRELEIALNDEIRSRRVKVIPILIDSCELPAFLRSKVYADFRQPTKYSAELAKIVRRVKAVEPSDTQETDSEEILVKVPKSAVCPDCHALNPIRCASCGKCFNCLGEKPSWLNKVVFESGYVCSSCSADNASLTVS